MKRLSMISFFLILSLFLILPSTTFTQENQVPASLKASIMQRLGIDTDITIEYSRPGVKGREIWGKLVPYGLAPGNRYSDNKPFPWRAGANENTTIEFSKGVLVEGKALDAGKYSIHMIPGEKEWTICFNKDNEGWGSFKYNQENDALRVTVMPVAAPFQEWLSFGFDDLASTSAVAFLCWEKIKVPFKIALPE